MHDLKVDAIQEIECRLMAVQSEMVEVNKLGLFEAYKALAKVEAELINDLKVFEYE